MRIDKTIKGEVVPYYVQFVPNELKAEVRYSMSNEWVRCEISEDCKYIILPDTYLSPYISGHGNVKVGKLTIPKHERHDLINSKNKLYKDNNKPKFISIQDLMMVLAKKGISTSMHYDTVKNQFYVDFETQAKSHLHLYEDGILRGRYDYEVTIDLSEEIDSLIYTLCLEFRYAVHNRSYCDLAWAKLCDQLGIVIQMYG